MSRDELLAIAERNKKKAQRAWENNKNRPGITAFELANLQKNVLYTETVYGLIYAEYWEE